MAGTGPRTGYVLVLRLELSDVPGTLGRVTTAIGDDGGDIGDIEPSPTRAVSWPWCPGCR